MENQEVYQRAKKRVEAKIGFYIHLAVYAGVNILLIIINLSTSPQYIWFKWPLLGWGTKEKMIEKEIKRESS